MHAYRYSTGTLKPAPAARTTTTGASALLPHACTAINTHLLNQELGRHKAGQAEGQVQVQVVEGAVTGQRSLELLLCDPVLQMQRSTACS